MLTVALALALAASPAPSGAHPLKANLAVDVPLTIGLGAWWISSETVFKKQLAPSECRLCDRHPDRSDARLGIDLLGTQLKLTDRYLDEMDMASNVAAFVVLPAGVFGAHIFAAYDNHALSALPLDFLIIAEAMVTAAALNQTVKFIAGRSRPFVFRLGQDSPLVEHPEDNNLSFYSGHSSWAFSMVAATATVAELRGYRLANWVWVIGLPLATVVPLMRIAADKHYVTDVVTGSLVGLGIGMLMPRALHARVDDVEVSLSAGPGGATVAGTF